tara:strand:- start:539 stop:994 length:456 start_codon:yes stop_codon:yes gene_type:complete
MKWLYFRQSSGIANDNGVISHHGGTNSTLRTSALLKYENLESILPFDDTAVDDPNGVTTSGAGEYIGVVMIFKSPVHALAQDGHGTTLFIAADKVYLETTANSASTCVDIIKFIESSEDNVIQIADVTRDIFCPGVLTVKHIEIAQNHRLS